MTTLLTDAPSEFGGRLTRDPAEASIEVREGLEAHVVGHFGDAGIILSRTEP